MSISQKAIGNHTNIVMMKQKNTNQELNLQMGIKGHTTQQAKTGGLMTMIGLKANINQMAIGQKKDATMKQKNTNQK